MIPTPYDTASRVARDPRADVALLAALRQLIRDEIALALTEIEQEKAGQPVVYFVQAEDGGPIKIGVAKAPEKRLRELQATSPQVLRILTTVPGGTARERELHSQFAEHRLHGEWFSDECEELLSLISEAAETEAVA